MGYVQTVTGPVDPTSLGFTLPAEHICHILPDEDVWAEELGAFKERGGTCVADITPRRGDRGLDNGRNPEQLRRLSQRTGVLIVMGCGWQLEPEYPPEDRIDRRSVASLAAELIAEIQEGIGSTGIKPGICGEFGPQNRWINPIEERIHRAAARACKATNIPLNLHAYRSPVGLDQLALLEEEGVNPGRVAVGHCDSYPLLDYWLKIIERGAWVEVDNVGTHMGRHEERLVGLIRELVNRGHEDRVLLSHDLGEITELRYHGGRGLIYLTDVFIPMLREAGMTQDSITRITSVNPLSFLSM